MSVPVLRAVTNTYKNLKITVLTRKLYAPFFSALPNISVYEAKLKDEHKGVFGLFKLSKELKKLGITKVADIHNVLRTNILKTFFLGKPFKQVNKGRAEKKQLISGEKFAQLKTTHQRYADVFKVLGYKIDLSNPEFEPKAELSTEIKDLIKFSPEKKIIGFAPFAAHAGKMYDLSQMEIVVKELSQTNIVVLFGGGKKEVALLNEIELRNEKVVSVAGKLSFKDELALISNLSVMVAMDSGNAHMAAMYGVEVITIWNVTHPFAGFYPFGQPMENALLADRKQYPKIPTSIYGNKYPEGYENAASKTISPKQIITKVKEVIGDDEELKPFQTDKREESESFHIDKFDWLLNESILTFIMDPEILMHYYDPKTVKNKQDPSWQNQGIYFWSNTEKFEKKSLPDHFLQFEKKTFLFEKGSEYVRIQSAKAIPWFGKPGGGIKNYFTFNNEQITIEEALDLKNIRYIKFVELTKDNLSILQDKANYVFVTDKNLSFKNTLPFYNEKPTSMAELYKTGRIKIVELL